MVKPGSRETKRTVAAARRVIEEAKEESEVVGREIELVNGIRIKLKHVPAALIRRVSTRLEKPKVPKSDWQNKGRVEENPGDPDYLDAMEQYNYEVGEAATNVILSLGIEVVHVPEGVDKIEDEGWVEILDYFKVDADLDSKIGRKLAWLQYYAITSEAEWLKVLGKVSSLIGMTEGEVADAVETFRSRKARGGDNGVPSEASPDGDNVQEDSS